jgi:hypothetical protein
VRIALARCTEPVPPLPRICRVLILPRHLLQRLTGRHHARPGGGELPALTVGRGGPDVSLLGQLPRPSPVWEWRAGHVGEAISDAGSGSNTDRGDKRQFVMSGDRDLCLCRRGAG